MSGYGALVFCSGRQRSRATAVLVSDAMPTEQIFVDVLDKRSELITSLQALQAGSNNPFPRPFSVASAFIMQVWLGQ